MVHDVCDALTYARTFLAWPTSKDSQQPTPRTAEFDSGCKMSPANKDIRGVRVVAGDEGICFTESESTSSMYARAQRDIHQVDRGNHYINKEPLPCYETADSSQSPTSSTSWLTDRSSYGSFNFEKCSSGGRSQLGTHHSQDSTSQPSKFAESQIALARLATNLSTERNLHFSTHSAVDNSIGGIPCDSITLLQDSTREMSSPSFQAPHSPVFHSHGQRQPNMAIALSPTLGMAGSGRSNTIPWQHVDINFSQPSMGEQPNSMDLNVDFDCLHHGILAAELPTADASLMMIPTTIPSSSLAPPANISNPNCNYPEAQVGCVRHDGPLPLDHVSDSMNASCNRAYSTYTATGQETFKHSENQYSDRFDCLHDKSESRNMMKEDYVTQMFVPFVTSPVHEEEKSPK